jgi:formylglycine-generating enzyme required for sulfatase activity/serine/threonine protein kinase
VGATEKDPETPGPRPEEDHVDRMLRLGLPRADAIDEHPLESTGPAAAWSSHLARIVQRLGGRIPPAERYRIEGELARGGQGVVLRVWDEDLQRRLAMKVVREHSHEDGPLVEARPESRSLGRFLDEIQISAQLDHPGIVPVHEVGMDAKGRVYFTMKLVKGRDLRAIFEAVATGEPGWTETRVLGVVLKVCEAMAYAHSKGVIHRDLKPGNVMVGHYGEVFVMDWGLARVLGREDAPDVRPAAESISQVRTAGRQARETSPDSPLVTRDGDVIGTPAYMPPEQACGDLERVSQRSDVYSIGALLYHLLAGHPPYVPPGPRPSDRVVLLRLMDGPPRPLGTVRPDLAGELIAIVERAMARDPLERYADTRELAEDLRAFLEHRVVRSFQTGPWAELRKWIERNRKLAYACAAGILALVAGLVASLALKARADENAHLAEENAQAALDNEQRAQASERIAAARAADLFSLSSLQTVEDLRVEADRLWPAEPANIPAYEGWLERARALVDELPEHERKLRELQAKPRAPVDGARATVHDVRALELELGWTLYQLGRFDEALAVVERSSDEDPGWRDLHAEIELAIEQERPGAPTVGLERHAQELEASIAALQEAPWTSEEDRWWAAQLRKLVDELRDLADPGSGLMGAGVSPRHGWGIPRRLAFARAIGDRSLGGSTAAGVWSEACASIADRDQCPAYEGLVLEPQLGLLPLGRDPRSGLWEFAHLATGDPAERGPDGDLSLQPETGLVFVLLPGGEFFMGAQSRFHSARNYDPYAKPDDGPVHPVSLSPFFLSKYEMTQGQWLRATGRNPSLDSPTRYELYWNADGLPVDLLHPVEQVSGYESMETLQRLGLALPSEAQWEYGARGGTSTVFWTGDEPETLAGAANLADRYASNNGGGGWTTIEEWLDDGNATHARVGSYAPNAFGLHDVCGNVWERCADVYDARFYENSPRQDPLSRGPIDANRISRGGSFASGVAFVRSGMRNYSSPESADNGLGLRPVLAIRRSR